MRPFSRRNIFIVIVIACLGTIGSAQAGNTFKAITYEVTQGDASTANAPICIGDQINFSVDYDGPDVTYEYKWYVSISGNNDFQEITGNGNTCYMTMDCLGTYDLKVTATCFDLVTYGQYTIQTTLTFVENPPDTAYIYPYEPDGGDYELGASQLTSSSPNIIIRFGFKFQGRSVNIDSATVGWENISRANYPAGGPNTGWIGGQNTPYITITNYELRDGKGISNTSDLSQIPVDGTIDELDQKLALTFPSNGFPPSSFITFPQVFHWRYIKVDNTHFKLILVP